MAHELDFDQNGVARMFSVRETPWHREGRVLTEAPRTIEEALELAGLDWSVERKPCHIETSGGGDYVEVPEAFAIVRQDTGRALGVVGPWYTPLQNRDAFRILQPLMDNGLAAWETAGALRMGRDVWGCIRFNIDSPIVTEVFTDEVVPYGLITNNHAGERAVILMETPVRTVCANTLRMALAGVRGNARAHKVRHTASMESKLTDAALNLWGSIVERTETCARQYAALKATFLDEALFRRLVLDVALPLPVLEPGASDRARTLYQTRTEKVTARRTEVRRLWTEGTGHKGDGSAWEAYNAAVEALDHRADLFPTRDESRVAGLILGRLGEVHEAVLDGLVAHALAVR
jgi:phage/plasmid-like protein (TIGR03299 family)